MTKRRLSTFAVAHPLVTKSVYRECCTMLYLIRTRSHGGEEKEAAPSGAKICSDASAPPSILLPHFLLPSVPKRNERGPRCIDGGTLGSMEVLGESTFLLNHEMKAAVGVIFSRHFTLGGLFLSHLKGNQVGWFVHSPAQTSSNSC